MRASKRPVALLVDGLASRPSVRPWARALILVGRGRCRLRWFRLSGIPPAERLAALRLQAQAWNPFDQTAGRLILMDSGGLAIAWDAQAAREQLAANGLAEDRYQLLPETLIQPPLAAGVRLLQCIEGFEAQLWADGELRASRWWPEPLELGDWRDFVRGSGASREEGLQVALDALPAMEQTELASRPWVKHYPLHASAEGEQGVEQRLVLAGGLALCLTAGVMGHQLWDVERQAGALRSQIADVHTTAGEVLNVRDATMDQIQQVEKLANWFALPQPIDVIGHLHDRLRASGVQIKELDHEGEKLRLGVQLTPNATRAGLVKDLQSGGWFTDVTEVRADNARNLLTMEMRINGPRPVETPIAAAPAPALVTGTPTAAVAAAPPVVATPAPAAAPSVPPPRPAPQAAAARPPNAPAAPIIAKPDALGMPPPEVFDAIPTQR